MKTVINLDTRQVVSDFGNNNPIGVIQATSQDTLSLEVYLVRGGIAQDLGSMAILFGLIKQGDTTDTLLASVNSFTRTLDPVLTAASGVDVWFYQALLHLDTVPMRTAMAAASDNLTCNGGFRYQTPDGEIIHTDPTMVFQITLPVIEELILDAVGPGGFTVPVIGSDVTIPLAGSTVWLNDGQEVAIIGAGTYLVISITDSTHFVGQNTGASGNAVAGTVIAAGAAVGNVPIAVLDAFPIGVPGGTGPAGQGLTWRGAWLIGTSYVPYDVVSRSGASYLNTLANTGSDPATDAGVHWALLSAAGLAGAAGTSFVWLGAWSSGTAYVANNVVSRSGSTYINVLANTGSDPATDGGTHWALFTAKGTDGTGAGDMTLAVFAVTDPGAGKVDHAILADTATVAAGLSAPITESQVTSLVSDLATIDATLATQTTELASHASSLSGLGTASTKNVPASGNASSGQCVLGSDSRLILPALDAVAAPTDITTLNASTSAHGLLKKLDGTATHYMDGTGAWSTPAGGGGGTAVYAKVRRAADALAYSDGTPLPFDTVVADALSFWNGSDGLVIPAGQGGLYLVTAYFHLTWTTAGTIMITVQSNPLSGPGLGQSVIGAASCTTATTITGLLALAAGDVVKILGWAGAYTTSSSGATPTNWRAISASNAVGLGYAPTLSVLKVG